jgi:hypothetical protein
MRALVLRAACLLALGLVPACSALGLADLPQSDCVNGGPGFCDSLAASNPTDDDCSTWQCNATSRHCEIMPRDDDGDDAASMMCAPAGTTPDCDDADAHDFPGNTETCNGRDEDCDGIIDDGVLAVTMGASAALTGSDYRATVQPDADETYVLARADVMSFQRVLVAADGTPTTATVQLMGPSGPLGITSGMNAPSAAIAGIGSNTYALVAQRSVISGCRQWALAPISGSSPNATLRTMDESLLPECPASGTSPLVAAPSVAGRTGAPLLVTWLETDPAAPRNCGSASAASVVLGTGQFDTRGNRIGTGPTSSLTLGESVDVGAAAALPLPAPTGTSAFLVAYPTADGGIAVHRITISALFEMAGSVVYAEPAGAMPRQGVRLSLGPTEGASTTVALSFYEGCGGSNAISVRWLTASGAAVTAAGLTTGIGTGVARSSVDVVYQPRSTDWLVAWRSSIGLSAQRVFEDGSLEGEPIDVLTTTTLSTYALEARSAGPLFQATTVSDGTNVQVLTFGCGAD